MSDTLANALVKLRHRIYGEPIWLSQEEARALYQGVLGEADVLAKSPGPQPARPLTRTSVSPNSEGDTA